MSDVVVTQEAIYRTVLEIKDTLHTALIERKQDAGHIADHESRIREIEAREDLSRRMAAVEQLQVEHGKKLDDIARKVWAIPSASVIIAAGVFIFTLIRTY